MEERVVDAPGSQHPLPDRRRAVFFDRDGTLIVDRGYTYRPQDLAFISGAAEAVRYVNQAGMYAFLVTNQSGVARGYFTESDVDRFHRHLQDKLRSFGAHLDDIRYCPFLPDAPVQTYARCSDWRKPAPGMLLDLLRSWNVQLQGSLVIGDSDIDVQAAESAGLRGLRFSGGNLLTFLEPYLLEQRRS